MVDAVTYFWSMLSLSLVNAVIAIGAVIVIGSMLSLPLVNTPMLAFKNEQPVFPDPLNYPYSCCLPPPKVCSSCGFFFGFLRKV